MMAGGISHHLSDTVKHLFDALSVGALLAAFFSWLPQVAALLTVIWFTLRIVIGVQEFRLNRAKLRGLE